MNTVKLGIVGVGAMGTVDAQNILEGKVPRCELSALCDPNLPLGRLVLDRLHETETAMAQRHAFKAAELCLKAQAKVQRIE